MTLTQARIAMRRAGRGAPFARVYKSSFGLGFLALTSYEVIAPVIGHTPTNASGIVVASIGLIAGFVLALRG